MDYVLILSIGSFIVLMFSIISIQSSLKNDGAIYGSEFILLVIAALALAWSVRQWEIEQWLLFGWTM